MMTHREPCIVLLSLIFCGEAFDSGEFGVIQLSIHMSPPDVAATCDRAFSILPKLGKRHGQALPSCLAKNRPVGF